jgi:hypothetical protein
LWSLINFEIWQRRFIDGDEKRAGEDCAHALDGVKQAHSNVLSLS